mgnify:CR=1 FL=1
MYQCKKCGLTIAFGSVCNNCGTERKLDNLTEYRTNTFCPYCRRIIP